MERINIEVQKREIRGKEGVKRLRKESIVPAVVYSEDTNVVLSVPFATLKALRKIHFSESAVIDLRIVGGKNPETFPALIKDIQFHPLTDEVIHIDFLKVSLKEKIKVNVAIVLKGESKEVKDGEGTLEQVLRELEVEGLPLDIPEKIEVDVTELKIGGSLHVSDLAIPAKVVVITDSQVTVVTALAKKEEVEEEIPVVEGEVATEPEVIKEKKETSEQEPGKEEEKEEDKKRKD